VAFETTQWSLVLAAGGDDATAADRALAALCEIYWYPLYAYVRRRGRTPDDARDLTQGFFTSLLERRDLAQVRQDRGRFRAFLLASLQHFLANDATRRHALKRGGGAAPLSLVFDTAEARYGVEPADSQTPEILYERRWALTVIDRVLGSLRDEWVADRHAAEFEALKGVLLGQGPSGGYAVLATQLDTTEGAVKVAVHRLRRRFRDRLREDISHTVADPAEIDEEIRYLIRALNR
jgi:DNA-directed RNA polymerase specialized sigma24 family protein